ncbi:MULTISPECIES: hypothetical protein [Acidovorax]|uniref:hypothetical protein n=1 Tax=Acidovorax TaxID=12916 RepID=UPI00030CA282|nr:MULTISPECIES: hypothetical protein [Acidovorax]
MKPLLLVAHPGHELRIFEWVRRVKPHVVILTNGDGSIGQARLSDTQDLLADIGVRVRRDWLEPVSDAAVYQALLGTAPSPFAGWLTQLTQAALQEGIDVLVSDQAEGYNPTHDLCRVLANCLVQQMGQAGRQVRNLEIPLVGHPCDPAHEEQAEVKITLSAPELAQKLAKMQDYARRCSPVLEQELQTMLDSYGQQAFATECLYTARRTPYEDGKVPDAMPSFERIGEERLLAGIYKHVIQAQHLRQLVQSFAPQR